MILLTSSDSVRRVQTWHFRQYCFPSMGNVLSSYYRYFSLSNTLYNMNSLVTNACVARYFIFHDEVESTHFIPNIEDFDYLPFLTNVLLIEFHFSRERNGVRLFSYQSLFSHDNS